MTWTGKKTQRQEFWAGDAEYMPAISSGNVFLQAQLIKAVQQFLPHLIDEFFDYLFLLPDNVHRKLKSAPPKVWADLSISDSPEEIQLASYIEKWTKRFYWNAAPMWFLEHITKSAFHFVSLQSENPAKATSDLCNITTRSEYDLMDMPLPPPHLPIWQPLQQTAEAYCDLVRQGGLTDELESTLKNYVEQCHDHLQANYSSFKRVPLLQRYLDSPAALSIHAIWFVQRVFGFLSYDDIVEAEKQRIETIPSEPDEPRPRPPSKAAVKDAVQSLAKQLGIQLRRGQPVKTELDLLLLNLRDRPDLTLLHKRWRDRQSRG